MNPCWSCCNSSKTWCRFCCLVATLAHGFVYAAVATFVVLGIKIDKYFPLARMVRDELIATSPLTSDADVERVDIYITCGLIGVNFFFALPYLAVAAYGTRSVCLLVTAIFFCTMELFQYLGVLVLAAAAASSSSHVSASSPDWAAAVGQWMAVGAMVSLLLITWSLLLASFKRRWIERAEAGITQTGTLVSAAGAKPNGSHVLQPRFHNSRDAVFDKY